MTTEVVGGIRIVDMPDLGAFTSACSLVGEHAGSGRFSSTAIVTGISAYFLPLTGGTLSIEAGQSYIGLTPFALSKPFVADSAQLFSRMNVGASGGTPFSVVANTRTYTTISGAPNAFIWGSLSVLDFSGTGGTGQHVATYGQGNRRVVASGGAANNPQIWAGVFEARDTTGLPSSSHGQDHIGIEVDIFANGADDAGAGKRQGISVVGGKGVASGPTATISTGIGIYSEADGTSFDHGIFLGFPYNVAAIDFRTATQAGGHAIWLGDGKTIAFSSTAGDFLRWDTTAISGAGALRYSRNVQLDAQLYVPNGPITFGGHLEAAGTGNGLGVTNDASIGGNLTLTAGQAYKPGGGPWSVPSDARIKDVLGDYALGTAELLQLRPVSYRYRPDCGIDDTASVFVGMIAQEVVPILPDMVHTTSGMVDGVPVDDMAALSTNELQYLMLNTIKQLDARIKALEGAA